jgi:hypothetical protein
VQTPGSGGGVAAVFAELNRGADVTKGLRKVEKSEMTHKNPALRASSTVPSTTSPTLGKKPTKPAKPHSLSTKKPAKFALEGNKWIIVIAILFATTWIKSNDSVLGISRERTWAYGRGCRNQPYCQFVWMQEHHCGDQRQGKRRDDRFVKPFSKHYPHQRLIKII